MTTPEGAKAVEQLGEDGITVGKPGNPLGPADKALKEFLKSLSKAENKIQIAKGERIRDFERLVDQYGGAVRNWEKMKGWMPSNNGAHDVEIHWYQNLKDLIGRVEPKSKL